MDSAMFFTLAVAFGVGVVVAIGLNRLITKIDTNRKMSKLREFGFISA
jgi:hypothetical protein